MMIDAMMMDDGDDGRDDEDTITMMVILEAHDSSSATAAGAGAKSGAGAETGRRAPSRALSCALPAVRAPPSPPTSSRSRCRGRSCAGPAQIADVDASRVRETDGAILERLELRGLLVDVCVRPEVFLHRSQIAHQ